MFLASSGRGLAARSADWGRENLMPSLPPSPCGRHLPRRGRLWAFRAPARVTFGRSPKSDQKVCLKPKVSRLPARYIPVVFGSLYRTIAEIFLHRAGERTVSASAPLPLISAAVEAGAPAFQSKSGSGKRSRDRKEAVGDKRGRIATTSLHPKGTCFAARTGLAMTPLRGVAHARQTMCRGGVLPRPKHSAKPAGGVEPLPYAQFYGSTSENRLSR